MSSRGARRETPERRRARIDFTCCDAQASLSVRLPFASTRLGRCAAFSLLQDTIIAQISFRESNLRFTVHHPSFHKVISQFFRILRIFFSETEDAEETKRERKSETFSEGAQCSRSQDS